MGFYVKLPGALIWRLFACFALRGADLLAAPASAVAEQGQLQ